MSKWFILISLLWTACPSSTSPPSSAPPPVVLAPDAGSVVYSWLDENGRIRMSARMEDIPSSQRARVVVSDTGRPRAERLRTDRIMVVDARQENQDGPVNYTLVDLDRLGAVKTGAPEADDPAALGRRAAAQLAESARSLLGIAPALAEDTPAVILYTAEWCGFCKKAAAHLRKQKIDFQQRDIDRDRGAAAELKRKLRQAGLRGSGIPVLDIGGNLVIGFDRNRIDQLLAKI